MSIIVKGMKMPENCHECEFVDILPTCPCNKMADDDFWNNVSLAVEGHKDCPLSKVETPHGRLIDADELQRQFERMANEEWNKNIAVSAASCFDDAAVIVEDTPTVIEREE